MPSTYTTNLGIEKIATGEQSGTWGTTTNTNLDLIDEAVNGVEQVTLSVAGSSGSPNDLPITNGTSSDGRNKFIEFVDGGDLGGTAFVQLTPNDAEKVVHIRNSLSADRTITIFQGTYNASNDFVIPNGADVVLKFDGAGAGAVVSDVYVNLTPTKLTTADLVATTADINGGSVDGATLGTNSAITEAQIDNINIDGNAITSTDTNGDITISPDGTGTVVIDTDLDVDNININGNAITSTDTNGDIALTPDGTGEVDISKVDIDSGTIDSTTIGGSTPAAGSFTTGQFDTSLNVDGTVTADGLTVSDSNSTTDGTDGVFVDVKNTDGNPSVVSGLRMLNGATSAYKGAIFFEDLAGDGRGDIVLASNNVASGGATVGLADQRLRVSRNGDISFYEDTGTTPKLFWDASAERLGIGTTSPSTALDIVASANTEPLKIKATTNSFNYITHENAAGTAVAFTGLGGGAAVTTGAVTDYAIRATANLLFGAGSSSERMRIDSSGNVGIGTSSPATALDVRGSSEAAVTVGDTSNIYGRLYATSSLTFLGSYNSAPLAFSTSTGTGFSEAMRIDSSGNVGIGTTNPSEKLNVFSATGRNFILCQSGSISNGQQAGVTVNADSKGQSYAVFKHAGITNACGYLGLITEDNASNFLWVDNGNTLRISTNSNHIGTTSGTVVGTQTSDERLKVIEPEFTYGLDAVMNLKPVAYTRNDEENSPRRLGFGAQSTFNVVPEAVYDTQECLDGYDQCPDDPMIQIAKSENTKLAMEYVQLIPVLTKAIQEQQEQISELKAEIETLKGA